MDSVKGQKSFGSTTALSLDFLATEEGGFLKSGGIPSFIPHSYMSDPKLRIEAYRRLAELGARDEVDTLRAAWRDRFGPLPVSVENALLCAAIRIEASRHRISQVEVRDEKLMLTRGGSYILIGGRFPRLTVPDLDFKLRGVLSFLETMQS